MRILFFVVLCILSQTLSGQDRQYIDSTGNRVSNAAAAKYYSTFAQHADSPALITESQFFISGQKKLIRSYSDTVRHVEHGRFASWFENGQLREEGNFIAGKPDGDLTMYFENGTLKRKEFHANGERVSGTCYNKEGIEIPFFDFYVPAVFPGGPRGWQNYLLTTLQYPRKSVKSNEQGTVVVKFIVDIDGSISSLSIDKSVSGLLDKEAMRVIAAMPNWKPGRMDGEIVRSFYKQPITFKLER